MLWFLFSFVFIFDNPVINVNLRSTERALFGGFWLFFFFFNWLVEIACLSYKCTLLFSC